MSLDKILRSEVNVNEVDDQLRAAHLILGYTPISHAFQALKCVIRFRDPRLHCISVTYEGFVVLEGIPISEGTPLNQPLFVAIPSVGASSTQPVPQEEEGELKEEEEEEKSPEEVVDLSESSDEFEVFNRTQSPEDILDEMGIQRKPQKSDGVDRTSARKRCIEEVHTVPDSPSSSQISSSCSSPTSAYQT